jgi:hypothetical protein
VYGRDYGHIVVDSAWEGEKRCAWWEEQNSRSADDMKAGKVETKKRDGI